MDPKYDRARVSEPVVVMINGKLKAEMLDISSKGAYLYTHASLVPDEIISLQFEIQGTALNLNAKVRHVEQGVGAGVEFVNIDKETLKVIDGYLDEQRNKPKEDC